MPQMNKGGKFIFGYSLIHENGAVHLPPQAVQEYGIAAEGKVYLFTGSKITGGFCVTRRGLLEPSKLGHILRDTPQLLNYTAAPGAFIPYKGRSYCWLPISSSGEILLPEKSMRFLALAPALRFSPSAAATSLLLWAQRDLCWNGRSSTAEIFPFSESLLPLVVIKAYKFFLSSK